MPPSTTSAARQSFTGMSCATLCEPKGDTTSRPTDNQSVAASDSGEGTMTELLQNYLGGGWVAGTGAGTALYDPVLANELVRVDATALDLASGFEFARQS